MTIQSPERPHVCTYCWSWWPPGEGSKLEQHLLYHARAGELARDMERCEAGPERQAPPERPG